MSVSFRFSRGRPILAPVRMRHRSVREPVMILDTGARVTAITSEFAAILGLEPEEREPALTAMSAAGPIPAALVRVASVSVLGLEVNNLPVICLDLPRGLGVQGLLGLNFLERFNIEISNETETLTLTEWRK